MQTFAVSQNLEGDIWLAIAIADSVDGASKLYLSPPISAQTQDWLAICDSFKLKELAAGTVIKRLIIGTSDDGKGSPLVIANVLSKGKVTNLRINSNFNDTAWSWADLTIPENAESFLGLEIGHIEGIGRGIYSLYRIRDTYNVEFTSLPIMVRGRQITESVQIHLDPQLKPRSISAL